MVFKKRMLSGEPLPRSIPTCAGVRFGFLSRLVEHLLHRFVGMDHTVAEQLRLHPVPQWPQPYPCRVDRPVGHDGLEKTSCHGYQISLPTSKAAARERISHRRYGSAVPGSKKRGGSIKSATTTRFFSYNDSKPLIAGLKRVYQAVDKQTTLHILSIYSNIVFSCIPYCFNFR